MKQINRRWWLTGAAVVIIITCVGILTWNTLRQAQPQLTAAQISDRVQEEYPGQITQIIQENGVYQVQLKSQQGTYRLTMDGRSGEMQTIKQIESASPTAAVDSNSNSSTDTSSSVNADARGNANTDTEPSAHSSSGASNHTGSSPSNSSPSSEASHSSGSQQTNNTDQNNSSKPSSSKSPTAVSVTGAQAEQIARSQVKGEVDDVKYEHNSKNGQQYYLVEIDTPDDREAVVQINSITGAVMSVTWDDEDDEDDQ